MADALLSVKSLNAWYGESHVLHGVDFEVNAGEVVTLLGRNGAGKTTTLKSVMGMVEHNMSVVADLSDTITVLTRGQVLAQGNYAELSKDERVKEAYLGAGHG